MIREGMGPSPKPLDVLANADVSEVVFFPLRVNAGCLGENILQLPSVEALCKRFSGKVTVVTGKPDVFAHMPGLRTSSYDGDEFDPQRELEGDPRGKLLIGSFPVKRDLNPRDPVEPYLDAIQQFTSQGGHVIPLSAPSLRLYSGAVPAGRTDFTDRHPFFPDPHLVPQGVQSRAHLLELGLHTRQKPYIPVSPQEAAEAEAMLAEAGMPPRGHGTRMLFNNLRGEGKGDYLHVLKAIPWVAEAAEMGVHVLVNPGYTRDDLAKGRAISQQGRLLSDNPGNIHFLDRGIPLKQLFPFLSCFDIVHSPDTGIVHGAAAVDGPLVLSGYASMQDFLQFAPLDARVLGMESSDKQMRQGLSAARLLLAGQGMEVFNDEKAALADIMAMRGELYTLDPVEDIDRPIDREKVMGAHKRLLANVKDDYRDFFGCLELTNAVELCKRWWLPMQQNQLYRFGLLAARRLQLQGQGPILPSPMDLS
jgi:hypothetical protein